MRYEFEEQMASAYRERHMPEFVHDQDHWLTVHEPLKVVMPIIHAWSTEPKNVVE